MVKRTTFGTIKPFKPPKVKNPFAPIKATKPKAFKIEPKKNPYEAAANKQKALSALATGRRLALTYLDCHRVVDVYTVGTSTAGRPAMSIYQVDGQSNTPPIPDWRFFCFDECFNVAATDIPASATRSDYKKGAKQFKFIDAER
jgi:hypothetical protein